MDLTGYTIAVSGNTLRISKNVFNLAATDEIIGYIYGRHIVRVYNNGSLFEMTLNELKQLYTAVEYIHAD